ncbi:FxSxx-COOH system tetratricopeptide repeat protein [Actinoplanes sp. NPDC026619]|uniref:FxSxx-COOH system tetratricopeptide repeat protein n=1 Tax=Actinoplanes sp. NPDC026619 TaxID=3155798 RepID=UPI0033EB5003
MSIALPGPDKVPEGPKRDLLMRLHELYSQAGKPATRVISKRIDTEKLESVSYETISSLLRGDNVPGWARLQSIIMALCLMSVHPVEAAQELVRFNDLWLRYDSPGAPPIRVLPTEIIRPARPIPPTIPARVVVARVHGELPARDTRFTGREKLLDDIEAQLAASPEKPLVLFGPIGAGKTQLAAEYVRLHRDRYAVTWWVDGANAERAGESLRHLAHRLDLDDEGHLFPVLEQAGPYLLVFDGVLTGDVRKLLNTRGGNVIATTRNGGWARDSPHAELEVPDLDPSEAAQLLRKEDPHLTPEQTSGVIEVAGRLPIGLAEACRLHHEQGLPWADLAGPLFGGGPVADAVRVVLRDEMAGETDLLRMLTLLLGFGPAPVWGWTLRAGADRDVSAGVHRLLRDPAAMRHAMRLLARSGLGRRGADGEWIMIPAIIRLVLRELLPEAYGEVNRHDVVQILVAADPGQPENAETLAQHRAIAPHIRPAALAATHRPTAYQTIRHQIRFLFRTGDLEAARQLGQDVEAALAEPGALAASDELILQIKRDLAGTLRAAGQYVQAHRLSAEAMAEVTGRTDRAVALDVARSWGHDLRIAGEFEQAYELDSQTARQHAGRFGADDFRTVASRYNLSVSRRFLGRFGEAEQADRRDLDRLRSVPGDTDRQARWANSLAEDLYGLGRYSEAEKVLSELPETESERELLRARRMAGVLSRRLGRLGPAVEQLGVCYQACVRELGEQRELTLAVCMSFGNALRDLGQFGTALHYCTLAVSGYQAAMGAGNPLVEVARANRAAVHLASGDTERAAAELEQAYGVLVAAFEERHPFTVLTAVNRAAPGSAELAREVFGPGHLDTLIAAARGPGLDQTLATLRRRFGAGHPLVTRVADGAPVVVDIELPSG